MKQVLARVLFSSILITLTFVCASKAPSLISRDVASVGMRDTEDCDTHYFDRDHLSELADAGAQNVNDLIKKTPRCFQVNQAAVYDSHSLQCATFKAPRLILYLNNEMKVGSICTFNSGVKEDYAEFYAKKPDTDCHENSLECEHFDADTNRFEFYEVRNLEKGGVSVSKTNPESCLTCHKGQELYFGSANPHPILENYPTWPGFYGSMHDKFGQTPLESVKYVSEFLKYKPLNERYATLPDVYDTSSNLYGLMKGDEYNSKPIVNLHNILTGQLMQRLGGEFVHPEALKLIWPYRYALVGALQCDDDIALHGDNNVLQPPIRQFPIESFIPEKVRKHFKITFNEMTQIALAEHLKNAQSIMDQASPLGPVTFEQFTRAYQQDKKNDPTGNYTSFVLDDRDNFFNSTRLAYLGENLGMNTQEWAMTLAPTYEFEAGARNFKQALNTILPFLIDDAVDQDLKLVVNTYLGSPVDPVQCEILRNKSLNALSTREAIRAIGSLKLESSNSASTGTGHGPPSSLSNCIACHVNGRAVQIPFQSGNALKAAFLVPAKTNPSKTLIQEAISRIDSGSMPPNTILSKIQRNELKKILPIDSKVIF